MVPGISAGFTPQFFGVGKWGAGRGGRENRQLSREAWPPAPHRADMAESRALCAAPVKDIKHSCHLWPNEAEPQAPSQEAHLPNGLAGTMHNAPMPGPPGHTHLIAPGTGAGRPLQLHSRSLVAQLHLHLLPFHLDHLGLGADPLCSFLQLSRSHPGEREPSVTVPNR